MSNLLIESYEEGFLSDFSSNYIRVKTEGDPKEINTVIPLKMTCVDGDEMIDHRLN